VGAGALLPLQGADGRGIGAVFDGAIARHIGVLNGRGSAFDVSFELRARLGVGALADYQSIVAGVSAAWEGGQQQGPQHPPQLAYRPGHTVSFQGLGGWFFSDGTRAGTNIHFGGGAGGITATAGLVLASPIELIARGGYLGRSPANKPDDWLHFGFVEGGARGRWYLFYLEATAGLFAPFGTFRDRVESGPFVSGSIGLRVPLVHAQDAGGRFLAGIRTQFALTNERSFDGIFFTAGFEFEGGSHHASFPRFNVSSVELATPSLQARGSAGTGVNINAGRTNVPITPANTGAGYAPVHVPALPPRPIATTLTEPAHIPLSISVGVHTGYISPLATIPLQRTVFDLSLTASWAVSHWLALDARTSWNSAAARTEDLTGDGLSDVERPGFGGIHLSFGPRFRWLSDTQHTRYGWSAGLAGGVLLPTFGSALPRGAAPTLDLVLAREVGVLLGPNAAFGAAIELRGRTGFGAWGDYQSLLVGARLWWEGNVRSGRNEDDETLSGVPSVGWRPGHTFVLDGGPAIFFAAGRRANGQQYFGTLGAHVGLRAGITFSPGFEWSLRGGYFNRPGENRHDDLAAVTLETGPRGRIGWLAARAMVGYSAIFGTQRDEVSSGLYAGAGVEARLSVGSYFRVLLGIEGRFALREERATDHIAFTVGVEFEGGPHRAVAFAQGHTEQPALAPAVVTNRTDLQQPSASAATGANGANGATGASAGASVTASVSASASVGLTLPLRFALSVGPYVGSRTLANYNLDGSGGAYNLTVAWVPKRWFSLDLTGGILAGAGYTHDSNGDGAVESRSDGLVHYTLSAGPRFRVLTDDQSRFGWSFHGAVGLIGSAVGVGPLGEFAIGRHIAAITDSHMAFELGIEARARVGYEPHTATTPDQGALFHALSIGLVGAWEANVHRSSAPTTQAQLGETLSLELGPALFLTPTLRNGRTLNSTGLSIGARTGLVFTRGFEWSVRGQFTDRGGEKGTAPLDMLLVETGPRMRWGWSYGELAVGYAGAFGAYRDEINSTLTASVGAGVRFGLSDDSHPSGGVSLGLQARFGLGSERAFDALFASVGFEFEGGRRRAAAFPDMSGPAVPRTQTTPTLYVTPVTSPRFQATGGVTQTVAGVDMPGQIAVNSNNNGSVAVGVNVSAGVAVTSSVGTLAVNASMTIGPFAVHMAQLDTQTLMQLLPTLAPGVSVIEVELRTPNNASALSTEAVLRDATQRRYGSQIRCIPRVLVGGAVNGGWEMTIRAQ
jgi:hypothetical protein